MKDGSASRPGPWPSPSTASEGGEGGGVGPEVLATSSRGDALPGPGAHEEGGAWLLPPAGALMPGAWVSRASWGGGSPG